MGSLNLHPVSAGMASLPALVSPDPVQLHDGPGAGCAGGAPTTTPWCHRHGQQPLSHQSRGDMEMGWQLWPQM
ncbi:hypothetical protein Nmel_018916 [Mimus melanotis]